MLHKDIKAEQGHFAEKYDRLRAEAYFKRFNTGFRKRIFNWFEQRSTKKALKIAGYPFNILDLPCGTGRFWQTLKHDPTVKLNVADFNSAMIAVGFEKNPANLTENISGTIASAFNLPFVDYRFDSVFCLRFIHHIKLKEERIAVFKELARVAVHTVCFSAWVRETGWSASRKLKKESTHKNYDKCVRKHSEILEETQAAGLKMIGYLNILPQIMPWRLYIMKKTSPETQTANITADYICPLCHDPLVFNESTKQYICHQENIAYPLYEGIPMLTKRDAIVL